MAEEKLLVPLNTYLEVGLHIGTKFKTKYMEPFIYKVRSDSLSVMNIQEIDRRICIMSKFLSKYKPEEVLVVCRRENGWKAIKKFSELTGIKSFAGRYPPGILTNPNLEEFIEPKILLVTDPWPDRCAINDAIKIGIPIIALCDTNNESNKIDLVVPCNNKGKNSLALIFWILSRELMKNYGLIKKDSDFKEKVKDFESE